MTRKELLNSPEYWIASFKIQLFDTLSLFLAKNNISKQEFSVNNNIDINIVNQILDGEYDGNIDLYVRIFLMCGKKPKLKV